MSDNANSYKAGDFTSGKMGEIFKSVFMESNTTVINHKQFGECYMIPKDKMRYVTNFALSSLLNISLRESNGKIIWDDSPDMPTLEGMKGSRYSSACRLAIEANVDGINTEYDWFSVLSKIVDLAYIGDLQEYEELRRKVLDDEK